MRFSFKVVVLLALASASAWADGVTDALLASPNRPTIGELKKVLSPWPAANPFEGKPDNATHDFEERLAMYIAEMEFAYPGLVYAPLGRDAVMIGDMVDAFYLAHGQEGRVRRLNASGQSFGAADREMRVGFLRTSGFDVDHIEGARPFIVLDESNFRDTSQSVSLIRAAYDHYAEVHGGDRRPLVRKLNIINLYSPNGKPIVPGIDREAVLKEAEDGVNAKGYPPTIFSVSTTTSTPRGRFFYSVEWHDSFGPLARGEDGQVTAPPGSQYSSNKSQVLYELYEVIERVSSPHMLELVHAAAQKLGYTFDFSAHEDCARHLQAGSS